MVTTTAAMPFKSRSQQRFFFSAESRGELPKGTALRWAHETPNIKALPDKKKEQTKKADYSVLSQGLIKGASLPRLKNANSFLGTLSDARNALFGESNLGRLDSWNNVKGYLPKSVSGYVDKNYVNPAINKQINETIGSAWKSLAAAGAATGSGLLGLYWLYNGLTRPKPPVREEVRDPVKFMAPSVKPLRTVNENLGLDASGRSLLKLSACVRKDAPGLKTIGGLKVGGWAVPVSDSREKEALVNLNPLNTVREGYGAIRDGLKARSDAQNLDKKMDQVNDRRHQNGSEHRILGHTYRINNKKFDIQFPSMLDYGMMPKQQRDQLRQRIGGMADLVPEDRQSIMAYFDQQSRMHPNMSLPKVRTSTEPAASRYNPLFNTVNLGLGSSRGIFGHEMGHRTSSGYRNANGLRAIPSLLSYGRNDRARLLEEQRAYDNDYRLNSVSPSEWSTPEAQWKAMYSRGLGTHATGTLGDKRELAKTRNEMLSLSRQRKMLNGQPSAVPQQYNKDLQTHINSLRLLDAVYSSGLAPQLGIPYKHPIYAPFPRDARVR